MTELGVFLVFLVLLPSSSLSEMPHVAGVSDERMKELHEKLESLSAQVLDDCKAMIAMHSKKMRSLFAKFALRDFKMIGPDRTPMVNVSWLHKRFCARNLRVFKAVLAFARNKALSWDPQDPTYPTLSEMSI